jgi:hypothetical protein
VDGLYFADLQARSLVYVSSSGGHDTVAQLPAGMTATAAYVDPATHVPVWVALQPETATPDACPGGALVVLRAVGEGLTHVAQSPGCVVSLAADASHLYWLAVLPSGGSRVLRAAHVGGTVEQVAELAGAAGSLALDASHLYWSERTTGRIMRRAKPR